MTLSQSTAEWMDHLGHWTASSCGDHKKRKEKENRRARRGERRTRGGGGEMITPRVGHWLRSRRHIERERKKRSRRWMTRKKGRWSDRFLISSGNELREKRWRKERGRCWGRESMKISANTFDYSPWTYSLNTPEIRYHRCPCTIHTDTWYIGMIGNGGQDGKWWNKGG